MDSDARAVTIRRTAYTLMTIAMAAAITGRILSVERVYEPSMYRAAGDTRPTAPPRDWPKTRPLPMPTFSSNDRSRWATIRSLVDEGTYAVGRRVYDSAGKFRDEGIITEDGWQTVDKVMNPDTKVFYSSKPPLLPTVLAGEYWLIKKLTGWTIAAEPWKVIVPILLTVNVVPLVAYLVLLARLLEQYGTSDWGRLFVFATACFGTFINTFSNSLNNHTLAAFTTLFAIYPLLASSRTRESSGLAEVRTLTSSATIPSGAALATSGFFAGLTFCLELPAGAFLVGLGAFCLWLAPRRTLLAFVPVAALPIGAQLVTNYIALGDIWPAYTKIESEWYQYEGSHWAKKGADRRGVDFAGDKESRPTYAMHLLVGHHGLFSLTPVWVLAFAGMLLGLMSAAQARWRGLLALTLVVSLVVIVFFAVIVGTVNYGGFSSGPRWFFWLTPLWLLALVPAADRLGTNRLGRGLAYVCLFVSVVAVSYPAWNPWRHPWYFQMLESWGLAGYG
jgi:hypothetical protein